VTRSSVLIVVLAFNEQSTVADVVARLEILEYDVLVVDDGSTDDTASRASEAGAVVLRLPINLGVGGALRAGFRFAISKGYSTVIQVDADGQHPVQQIPEIYRKALESHAHLVIGSRYLSDETTHTPTAPRRLAMRLLGAVVSRVAGVKITDSTSGFRVITQPLLGEFAQEFPSYYLGDTFEATVRAIRGGYKVIEVPAAIAPRLHGQSSTRSLAAIALICKVLFVTLAHLSSPVRRVEQTTNFSNRQLPGS
jgi:glycosyltransferase involved in cell wall biosynthesis